MTWPTPKTSSAKRGYGGAHAKARAAAALRHSPSDPCARCGLPLGPMGPWLHYDHADTQAALRAVAGPNVYLGFSHKRCNIKAGARKGARVANRRRKLRRIVTADRW